MNGFTSIIGDWHFWTLIGMYWMARSNHAAMKRLALALVVCLLTLGGSAWGREKLQGWCSKGGVQVSVPGLGTSSTKFIQSFPACTVTVYLTGTSTLAVLYSDDASTPKSNPFTADTSTGLWFFYADNARYDVKFSGTGIASPFTLSDWLLYDPSTSPSYIVDNYCTTPGVYDETCWQNLFDALPITGGTVQGGSHNYTINTGLTLTAKNNVKIFGVGSGSTGGGTRLVAANAAVTPILAVTGASTANLMNGLELHDLEITTSVFGVAQQGLTLNNFNNTWLDHTTFTLLGQGIDADYGFRLIGTSVITSSCGSGATAATSCIRMENRTNPAVSDEQFYWFDHLCEGDQNTFTHTGTCLYFGPSVNQFSAQGKFDLYNTGTTAPAIWVDQASIGDLGGLTISAGGAHPSTATANVYISGTSGNRADSIILHDSPQIAFLNAVRAVKTDYASNILIEGNTFKDNGSGSGYPAEFTANTNSYVGYLDNGLIGNTNGPLDNSVNGAMICGQNAAQLGTYNCRKFSVWNNLDAAATMTLKSGKTSAQNFTLAWDNYNGDHKWSQIMDTSYGMTWNDLVAGVARVSLTSNGSTVFNAPSGSISSQIGGVTKLAVNSATVATVVPFVPSTAAGTTIGSTTLPFSSLILGNAANQTAGLIGTFTNNRTVTLPDNSGTLAELNLAQTWSANQAFTTLSATGQVTSTLATGTAPFAVSSTTPVANLTTVPTTYNTAGTQQIGTHIVIGSCTLGTSCSITLSGAAVFSSSSSYQCSATDETAAAAVKFAPSSGSAFALTGTGTDLLSFTCVGN